MRKSRKAPHDPVPDGLQRAAALCLAIATSPLQVLLAILIRLDSPGSPLYFAERVGSHGHRFRLLKLRTMRADAAARGPGVSMAADPRVTRVGRALRHWRLDELPQLWNVARGEMRLIGPRPEDARFVDLSDPLHRLVFTSRPGITGPSQLVHLDEALSLDPARPEESYRHDILPAKLQLDAAYLRHRSTALDLWLLMKTVAALFGRRPDSADLARRLGIAPENCPGGAVRKGPDLEDSPPSNPEDPPDRPG